MKFEFELNKKGFEKAVIKEIARQILTDENNDTGMSQLRLDDPMEKILMDKSYKLLASDKDFDKKLTKDLKLEIKNKKLIRSVAKEVIREKLE